MGDADFIALKEKQSHQRIGNGRTGGADEQRRPAAKPVAQRPIDQKGTSINHRSNAEDMAKRFIRHQARLIQTRFGHREVIPSKIQKCIRKPENYPIHPASCEELCAVLDLNLGQTPYDDADHPKKDDDG